MEASERVATADAWSARKNFPDFRFEVVGADGIVKADCYDSPTAVRIVRAVNAHDALLAACQEGRTALALAMQVLHEHLLDDEFIDRAQGEMLKDGIGIRMREAIAGASR